MRIHRIARDQWICAPPREVFEFFSNAANLDAITPEWLGFLILTPLPLEMRTGARLEYRLRLAALPVHWRTRISLWDPPRGFVDVQESSPFALWEHRHRFTPRDGGVLMHDHVRFALPFGPLGDLAYALAVRSALAAIFDHRYECVRERFPSESEPGAQASPERAGYAAGSTGSEGSVEGSERR